MQRAASTGLEPSVWRRGKDYLKALSATGACLILTIVSFGVHMRVLGFIFGALFVIGLPTSAVLCARCVRRGNAIVDEALRANAEAKARYLQQ